MIPGVESLGRVRARGIVILILAFLAGGILGVAVERIRVVRTASMRPFDGPFGASRQPGQGQLPRFYERLDLSQAQKDSMQEILERARPRTDSLMRQTVPLIRVYMDSIQRELRAVLTEQQREQLDRERETRPGRGMRRRAFGPGGPDPLTEPPPEPPEQP
jgi:Spy/CpxP family protein refolding chaperone